VAFGFVWLLIGPDLRWRWRRFAVTTVGIALLFALTLLLTGYSQGFLLELERTQSMLGGDAYVIDETGAGPMTSFVPFPSSSVDEIANSAGATGAYGMISLGTSVTLEDGSVDSQVIGLEPGSLPGLSISKGRDIQAPGEFVIDETAQGIDVGDTVIVGGVELVVVGESQHTTVLASRPMGFMVLADAQTAFVNGADLVTSVVVNGELTELPAGLKSLTPKEMKDDLGDRLEEPREQIFFFQIMLWVLAFIIVAAVLYLAALERVRDFAVFKATGARTGDLMIALAVQSALLTLVAALVSIGLAHLLVPVQKGLISLPITAIWPLPVLALLIGIVGSAAGVRKAVTVDPAQAFGGP
jgi:putative ABC transport system permease protein